MEPRWLVAILVFVAGQAFFGFVAGFAVLMARKRAARRAFLQIMVIIVLVESLLLALGGAALNTALHGPEALTAVLVWYSAAGWIAVQIAVLVRWGMAAWRGRRAR